MKYLFLHIQGVRTVHIETDDAVADAAYEAIRDAMRRHRPDVYQPDDDVVEVALSTGRLSVCPGAVAEIQIMTADEAFVRQQVERAEFEGRVKAAIRANEPAA